MDCPIWYAVSAQVIKRKLWTIKIYDSLFENNECVLFQGNIKTEDNRHKLNYQNLRSERFLKTISKYCGYVINFALSIEQVWERFKDDEITSKPQEGATEEEISLIVEGVRHLFLSETNRQIYVYLYVLNLMTRTPDQDKQE